MNKQLLAAGVCFFLGTAVWVTAEAKPGGHHHGGGNSGNGVGNTGPGNQGNTGSNGNAGGGHQGGNNNGNGNGGNQGGGNNGSGNGGGYNPPPVPPVPPVVSPVSGAVPSTVSDAGPNKSRILEASNRSNYRYPATLTTDYACTIYTTIKMANVRVAVESGQVNACARTLNANNTLNLRFLEEANTLTKNADGSVTLGVK